MINYNAQDEQLFQSVSSLMAGNMESYYTMYDLSIKYIYKIIYDIVKDYHTTEDLVQETYITIYNKINTLQDPRKFYSWAGRIATNHTLRYIQNNRRELLTLDVEDGDSDFIFDLASQDNEEFIPENILMDMEKQRLIAEIIDGLSVEQKLAVQYFYYEELSVREIAELMGCSEGTIKSRLNYARKSIKEAIIDLDVNEDTRLYSLSALPIFFIVFKTAVEQFVFAGTAAGTTMASGMAAGGAGAIGEGTASGATAVGGASNAGQVLTVSEAAGSTSGAAVASTAGKGLLAKIGTSLGAKIAAGVVATGLVVAGGAAIHHVVTENKEEPTEITTEVIEDVSEADTNATTVVATEETTEETTEATTEEVVEEVTVSDEELLALNTLAINLTATEAWKDIKGKTLDINDAIVWEFVGRMNNNAQYDGVETRYMPKSAEMNVYTLEDMSTYASAVFGIDDLEYANNFWFSDRGDGTYYLTMAQMGDLDKCVIKSITVDGDTYTVIGVISWGEMMDLNQTEPSYSVSTTFEFTMEVEKSSDSPFGFKVNGISYIQGMMADLESTEPPVVTTVGIEGGDDEEDVSQGTLTEEEYEEQRKDDLYTCTSMRTASSAGSSDKAVYEYLHSGQYALIEVTPGATSTDGIKITGTDPNYVYKDGRTASEIDEYYKSEFLRMMGDDIPYLCYTGGSSLVPGPIEAYYIYISLEGKNTIYLGPAGLTVDQILAEQPGDNIYAILPTPTEEYKTWE